MISILSINCVCFGRSCGSGAIVRHELCIACICIQFNVFAYVKCVHDVLHIVRTFERDIRL